MKLPRWSAISRHSSRQPRTIGARLTLRSRLEYLEDRTVPSLTVGANVNITHATGNQAESTISINPTNPLNLYENDTISKVGHYSVNGGSTWLNSTMIATPPSIGDVQSAWDSFGNLYLTYLTTTPFYVVVALSTNGGASFTNLTATPVSHTNADQPSIAVGPGNSPGTQSVWVSWTDAFSGSYTIAAAGAQATGLGTVGSFTTYTVPGSLAGDFGDIAVGPSGQVMVSYQYGLISGAGPDTVVVNTRPAGAGSVFGAAVNVTPTQVGGNLSIPAQPSRTIDAEANLAWDRSGGPHNGRVYLVYLDEVGSPTDYNTNILVRHSDDSGATWSAPIQVNDDATTRSQFMPAIAVDQTTGNVAVTWYDARNSASNTTVQVFGSASIDGGMTFEPNVQMSTGTTDATVAAVGPFNLGDYDKMDFRGGIFYRTWGDNSNSTGNNPNGAMNALDIYIAPVTAFATAPESVAGVQINDGSSQRSRVTSLTVNFDPSLTLSLPASPANAFQLKRQSDSALVSLNAAVSGASVTLTFTGGPVDANSLADGRYTLTVFASQINGGNFDGDPVAPGNNDYVLVGNPASAPKLFRLYGDADGNGVVDGVDFGAFRLAFNTNSSVFDFDGSGIVDGTDFGQFRFHFGVAI